MIKSPLRVPTSKKRNFTLNLNQYRNTHFHVLNKAKVLYKEIITPQIASLSLFTRVKVIYTYYPPTKRRTDLGNVLSIHQKFFEDAFVEAGKIIELSVLTKDRPAPLDSEYLTGFAAKV